MPPLKPYSSELNYSYAPGVFPSLQLMQNCPERAQRLLLSEKASGEGVEKLRESLGLARKGGKTTAPSYV